MTKTRARTQKAKIAKGKAHAKHNGHIKPNGHKILLPAAKIKGFKNALLKLQEDLMTALETKKEKDLEPIIAPQPGDDADAATQTYEKEMLFEISDNEREMLMQVEGALRRIQMKTFGACESCEKAIPLKRLKVIPYTPYCLVCQSKYESHL